MAKVQLSMSYHCRSEKLLSMRLCFDIEVNHKRSNLKKLYYSFKSILILYI
jgi:hypothetical protein